MGTPSGIKRPFPFTHALSLDEHVVQHTCGAHFLSWSPTLQPKYKKYALFYSWSNRTLPWTKCHFSANIAEVARLIYEIPGHFFINMLRNLWQQTASWNYHETIPMKELGDTLYNTTIFVQHLISIEESWKATLLLITWRISAVTRTDHVISSWYGCCQLLNTGT